MKVTKTTTMPRFKGIALACCFALLPALTCGQSTDDKNKKKAAPAQTPAAQQPARQVQPAPAPQQATPRPVPQAPPQQQPAARAVQQPPVQRPPTPMGGGRSGTAGAGNTPIPPTNGITGGGAGPSRGGGITGGGTSPSTGGITGGRTLPSNGGGISGVGVKPPLAGPTYHPQPGVQSTRQPDGGFIHADPRTGAKVHTDPGGRITNIEKPGLKATGFRSDGRAAHIEHTRADGATVVVNRGVNGGRRIESVRPGGVRVVANGRQAFVERPLRPGFVSRTYVVGGRTEIRVFRTYSYPSIGYATYVPRVYYQTGFYGWAARPWGAPVVYSWGWAPGAPWFYGSYFTPAPVYSSPALWVTDFLLAANLRAAYDDQQQRYREQPQDAPIPMDPGNAAALTPEVKLLIADEVRQQIAAEQAAAAQPAATAAAATGSDVLPPALKQRVFVVSTNLDVAAPDGGESCSLTAGDIIERSPGQTIDSDGKVPVNVISSKAGDCRADLATKIDLATLQEMQNQFREQISSGMENLASNQGKSLPASPAAVFTRQNGVGQAPASAANDAQAKDLVAQVNQDADQTETDLRKTASGQ